ncbi:actin binding protein [Zymoseptoria brevis]|uniref:Actin binding protein n=1 Tax=Zymoseptoria brevis TaxID=1047168 RepID=A0A0F4GUQ0_9PEZI|nr:actin binding protein [Zymoseptoria brevis]
MASLNLSQNGPAITNSYQKIVNASPSGPAASSPTYGIWALFSVKAPLANAFQADASKESVLSVQTTGEGELADLIEDFSDGRIQFAFVKVKDPNTTLPKSVLIAWCGEGVPERTKGYFTSHLNAVSKLLHGYHVQVTARSDRDLTPELIVKKVQDSSGSKYSGGGSAPSAGPAPPVASKPVLPTKSFGASSGFQALGARTRAPASSGAVDDDGWGQDAPQVSRSQLEKVAPAYQPTKVNMAELQNQRQPSQYQPPLRPNNNSADVVSGGYQPIGKVDIAALRAQAKTAQDDRPTVVKGAYEPIGKVDISEIRRKAHGGPAPASEPVRSQPSGSAEERPQSLADRSAAFQQGGRLAELPKPKVANKFGSSTSNFAGTKAPAPGGFQAKSLATAAPVGTASKTFADEGGKTPAQIWAEKKARARGDSGAADTQRPSMTGDTPASPIGAQTSGAWQSGYEGKKWGVQIPSRTGGSGISEQRTGQDDRVEAEPTTGGVGSIRDRFAGAPEPPALDTSSKPNASARGVPMPGLPQRAPSGVPKEEHQDLPPPPPRGVPDDEDEDEEPDSYQPQGSPVRIAMPVGRSAQPIEPAEQLPPRAMPTSLAQVADDHQEPEAEPQVSAQDDSRLASQEAAASTFGSAEDPRGQGNSGGKSAIAQYDYTKDEENEIDLTEGERIINIEMVDDDWWIGENSKGEKGLFPSNYVELVEAGADDADAGGFRSQEAEDPRDAAPPPGPPQPAGGSLPTATAEYDYEAAEPNELSFPDGAKIINIEFPDENWWSGEFNGQAGLFPANYVKLDE